MENIRVSKTDKGLPLIRWTHRELAVDGRVGKAALQEPMVLGIIIGLSLFISWVITYFDTANFRFNWLEFISLAFITALPIGVIVAFINNFKTPSQAKKLKDEFLRVDEHFVAVRVHGEARIVLSPDGHATLQISTFFDAISHITDRDRTWTFENPDEITAFSIDSDKAWGAPSERPLMFVLLADFGDGIGEPTIHAWGGQQALGKLRVVFQNEFINNRPTGGWTKASVDTVTIPNVDFDPI